MQIFRNLLNRAVSICASLGTERPRSAAILALGVATSISGTALGQAESGVFAERRSSASESRGRHLAQAPMSGVPQVGHTAPHLDAGAPSPPMVTDMPSVIGPPMVENSSVYHHAPVYGQGPAIGAPVASQVGYEIPCPSGAGCDVSVYASYEALWLKRENDEQFSLSRNDRFDDFDYDFGGRYTIGRIWDCVNGVEAVYAGPYHWRRSTAVTGPGNLISNLLPSGGYTSNEVNAFNSANFHSQAQEIDLHSYELNRRWWAWDVLSTMIGLRVVDYRESYAFLSQRPAVGSGLFAEQTRNTLVGVHVGGDLMYPVGLRTIIGTRGKAGVFANFDEATVQLINAGTSVLDNRDTAVDVAGVIEYGIFARYQVVPSIRLMAGYEFWYMPGIATVNGQQIHRVNPDSGSRVDNDDSVFLHGGGAGVQVLF